MTFWLDAQLDPELADWLGATFKIIAKYIREVGLRDASDEELFLAARRLQNVVIITKDDDFLDLVQRYQTPPQIIWLRFPNMTTIKMRSLLSMIFAEAIRLIDAGAAIVEISVAGQCTEMKRKPRS